MKNTIIICLIILAVLSSCGGTPVVPDRSGYVQPVVQETPNLSTNAPSTIEYSPGMFSPTYNIDGSITMFSLNNLNFRIMPMTHPITRSPSVRSSGETDTLIVQYTRALEVNPNDIDTYIILAGLHLDRGRPTDTDLAIKYSSQALEISNNNPLALYSRSLAYNEKRDNQNALKDLNELLRITPQSQKGVYYMMGMIYYRENNYNQAIESFERVKTIDPNFADTNEILTRLYRLR